MNITGICAYETPCGWCSKWDKKCDKKIGYESEDQASAHNVPCGLCAKFIANDFRGCTECNASNNYKYFIKYTNGAMKKGERK